MRKLEVAIREARRLGTIGVLTFGKLDSNHALAAAPAVRAAGLEVELYIQTEDPWSLPERKGALEAAATRVVYGRSGGRLAAGALLRSLQGRLAGRRRYLLPPGGTNSLTTAAVALAVLEVVEQFRAIGEPLPLRWAVAVGSGGTLAGLWAGIRLLGLPSRPVGFLTSSKSVSPRLVAWLANRALRELGHPGPGVSRAEIDLTHEELGAGHGKATDASQQALSEWAAAGVPLDPIYTAKAAAGLRKRLADAPGSRWLFWHTGITVGP